jgi:hypothetical protein
MASFDELDWALMRRAIGKHVKDPCVWRGQRSLDAEMNVLEIDAMNRIPVYLSGRQGVGKANDGGVGHERVDGPK